MLHSDDRLTELEAKLETVMATCELLRTENAFHKQENKALRMMKLKKNISGTFRSASSAKEWYLTPNVREF